MQIGALVFPADQEILEGRTSCTLLSHKSKKTPRVVRSTLAGEAAAQHVEVYDASWLSKFLSEMLTGRPACRRAPIFEVIAVPDWRSLRGAPSLAEKRTVLDVISIRDEVSVKNVRWFPTMHRTAEGMTEEDASLCEKLAKFLADLVLSRYRWWCRLQVAHSACEVPSMRLLRLGYDERAELRVLDDESLLWASCSLLRCLLTPAGSQSNPVCRSSLCGLRCCTFNARAWSGVLEHRWTG